MRFFIILLISLFASWANGLAIPLEKRQSGASDILDRRSGSGGRQTAQLHKHAAVHRVMPHLEHFKTHAPHATHHAVNTAYHHTKNLPHPHARFHIPAGDGKPAHTYTGQHIHDAVLNYLWETERHKTLTEKEIRKTSPIKPFSNFDHHPRKEGGGDKPLPHMLVDETHPKGKEWPLFHTVDRTKPGPARIIMQHLDGHHVFQGVIAHDQSRVKGLAGYDDHFHVVPTMPS
ncbi:hypothetical protein BDN70DRAFT_937356 [Pholiota conissans]|uniref:Uncharacterized protein n=1 Tax=Pholiota conissans TaxID=109636 RepID=A0A9P6CNI3_9AGAR|nr:hypothetical protein BDN70DRAFT_937356 [Pholiota conissans]